MGESQALDALKALDAIRAAAAVRSVEVRVEISVEAVAEDGTVDIVRVDAGDRSDWIEPRSAALVARRGEELRQAAKEILSAPAGSDARADWAANA